ncbi:aldo/keto reductase [Reyranella sp.]|uniref:aldo/keto reductase n=1 Tax=Reyranella sp. TaxID=1929291 RepID=UPI00122B012E|nr:aldo/keto reductase [Reyranella sp.]TAJ83210.1 MAG: aldo/keto reductase [Reyranella sp.]
MERRRLGRTGLNVSVLGYGAGAVGGLFTKGAAADQERALSRALEAGINYFDTAPVYGNGESERNLGRALKALKADVVVGTKVRLTADHRADVAGAIVRGMEESLKRMGRDHVDLFQLHNPLTAQDAGDKLAIDIVLEQVAPAMEKLKASGKTRFIGFSGVGEPAALLRAVESKLFDTVQVVYNALNPSAGGPMPAGAPGLDYGCLLDKAKAADMGTIIIRALAGGALSGTTDRHPLAMQDVAPIGSAPDFAADVARAKKLEPLVRDGVAGSLTELGERFVISHPAVSTMLIGYSNLDHLEAAIAAVEKGPLPSTVLKRVNEDT